MINEWTLSASAFCNMSFCTLSQLRSLPPPGKRTNSISHNDCLIYLIETREYITRVKMHFCASVLLRPRTECKLSWTAILRSYHKNKEVIMIRLLRLYWMHHWQLTDLGASSRWKRYIAEWNIHYRINWKSQINWKIILLVIVQ